MKRHLTFVLWPFYVSVFFLVIALVLNCGEAAAGTNPSGAGAPSGASASVQSQAKAGTQNQSEKPTTEKGITQDAKVGLIGALAGAVIGGLIAWFAGIKAANRTAVLEAARDRKKEAEEDATVRAMLDVEIELNLNMLREEEARLKDQPEDATSFEWIAMHPCPQWSTVVWEHSVLLVHRALEPKQVIAVQGVYTLLHSLTVARNAVVRVIEEGGHHKAEVAYRRSKQIMGELLKQGNPLRPPALKDESLGS